MPGIQASSLRDTLTPPTAAPPPAVTDASPWLRSWRRDRDLRSDQVHRLDIRVVGGVADGPDRFDPDRESAGIHEVAIARLPDGNAVTPGRRRPLDAGRGQPADRRRLVHRDVPRGRV